MLTLIGTLAGVFITAVFGLLSAHLSHRWQYQRATQEHSFLVEREIRTARHEKYARLVVAAQALFDNAMASYQANRNHPVSVVEYLRNKPQEIDSADTAFEICRVEAYLLAGPSVREALDDYNRWLRAFWPEAASGTSISRLDDTPEAPYHRLIRAMRAEVVTQVRGNSHY
jgi:type VI protein secretion system component VasK